MIVLSWVHLILLSLGRFVEFAKVMNASSLIFVQFIIIELMLIAFEERMIFPS